MKTLIKGGKVVTAIETMNADVMIVDEKVVGLVDSDSDISRSFSEDALVIDATDRLVVPGGIDVHTHFESEGQIAPVLDTFETGTRASAFGGTTTIIDFAWRATGGSLLDGLEHYHQMAQGDCAVDYGFHMMVNEVDDQTPKEMDMLVDEGITSFKMFMAYPGRMYSTDAQLLTCYQKAGENGALIQMHAENGIAIDVLRDQAVENGQVDPVYHSLTRPALLEAEAVHRSVVLAEIAGCPLYIVHLSSAEALQEVVAARDRGLNVFAETCPQYLFLDLTDLERPDFEGSKYVCSPPLRPSDHQAELWRGLATNDLQVIATDHCPFCWPQKELGRGDFRNIPNGAPAQMFGLYPRKGTIAPGADADIVLFDPDSPHAISADTHHMNVDYSCYEGHEVTGKVDTVLLRGKVVVEGTEYLGRAGDGQYMSRGLCDGLI